MEHDQEFVEYVVKNLVDTPDGVSTDRTVDEMGVLITLKVDPKDLGQVIGRNGQTAKAIRTLLRVVGAKNQARVNMKIYEPEGHRKEVMRAREEAAGAPAAAPSPDQPDHVSQVESGMDDLKL